MYLLYYMLVAIVIVETNARPGNFEEFGNPHENRCQEGDVSIDIFFIFFVLHYFKTFLYC